MEPRSFVSATDPYDLTRFVQAQERDYEQAMSEIRGGLKRSHWMWYIFPQFEGLGSSSTSTLYAIKSIAEAEAFLRHPVLGPRLLESAQATVDVEGRSAFELFSHPGGIMKRIAVTSLSIVLLAASLSAKGPTLRIQIRDTAVGAVTEIRDRAVLDQFIVWDGRGTFSGPPDREVEASQGFIIDWQAGAADSRPGHLRRYEVRFFASHRNLSAEELAYVVFYENDPSTGKGYVYLPGESDEHFRLNVQSIHRGNGLEGHWLHASSAWQRAIAKLPTVH